MIPKNTSASELAAVPRGIADVHDAIAGRVFGALGPAGAPVRIVHDAIAHGEPPRGSLASVAVPTLVVHGSADPMFPLEHGRALAEAIPGATLIELDGAGHGVDRADWDTLAQAIVSHTRPTAARS